MHNLNKLNDWSSVNKGYFVKRSAQSYMGGLQDTVTATGTCGSSCPASCGSSCTVADNRKPAPKPAACGFSYSPGGK